MQVSFCVKYATEASVQYAWCGQQTQDCHLSPPGHCFSIDTTQTLSVNSEKLRGNTQGLKFPTQLQA